MTISKKVIIEIRQVANGYIVMPPPQMNRADLIGDDDRYVFQTFAELIEWLGDHFTLRADGVLQD